MAVPVRHSAAAHGYGSLITLLLCALTIACSSSTAPSTPPLPLAVTGQSQVGIFLPYLRQDYAGTVVDAWEGGNSIQFWGPEDRMWRALAPLLHQRLRALVYSQGESDCAGLATAVPDYGVRFSELMTRIRREANDPTLRIVVVSVTPVETCAEVRRVQAMWIAGDACAQLVNADDLPRVPFEVHFTAASGAQLAQRIVDALQGEPR